ncbi:MAG: tetratricopeptide repeat protein [Gemmatimonadaceae bacterium]
MTSSGLGVMAAVLLLVAADPAASQEHPRPRGETAERLGTVHFETSCSPDVAPRFDRAVALLHSFEFGESLRAFDEVLAADSTCAMAHWGIALSRWGNPMAAGGRAPALLESGRASAAAATRLGATATERERGYIRAVSRLFEGHERIDQQSRIVAYERAMADLAASQPADTEAAIFHAIALTASAPPTDRTYASQLRAGAILEELWASQPDHPGLAHYIIHTYDFPSLADRASEAARRYSRIAPSAAHALHMPSHTFTRVGLWEESVASNLRSIETALRDSSIAEALHASDYAVYAYLQMQRHDAARAMVDGLPALAARFDVNAVTGAAPGSAGVFAIAAIPARYALERGDWRQASRLAPESSAFPWTEAMVHFARALGASRTGDLTTARASIDSLAAIRQRLEQKGESYWAEQVAIQELGARAWLDHAEHRDDAAIASMRQAAEREDATEKSAVTPGPLAPARELLGDMLLELERPAEALVEYRAALLREPNRYRTVDGARRAAAAAGDRAAEASYAAQLRKITGT